MTDFAAAAMYASKEAGYFAGSRADIAGLLPETVSRVLEIGCGTGATMRWLRSIRQIEHASGIELMADAASNATSAFDDLLVGNIEALELPFPPHSFDLIMALDVLEHLVDPWTVISRCHGLLKPGGAMIASLPNVGHHSVVFPLMLRARFNYVPAGLLDRTHLRFFVEQTALELMTSSGMVAERLERTRLLPDWLNRVPDRLGGPRMRWYTRKLLDYMPFRNLNVFRFLIRVRAPA